MKYDLSPLFILKYEKRETHWSHSYKQLQDKQNLKVWIFFCALLWDRKTRWGNDTEGVTKWPFDKGIFCS